MIRQTRNPPIAPIPRGGIVQVAPVIPREGLWSGYNQLGYLAKYDPDNRGRQTILKLDEWGPPEIWTVSLYVRQKLATYNGFGIKASIGFGAGGSTHVIDVDWLNGAQVSLPLNAVNVIATFEDVDITTEGQGLQIGVQLSRGTRGGDKAPTNTMAQYATAVNTASEIPGILGTVYEIPLFSKNIVAMAGDLVSGAAFYSADLSLSLLSGNGGGVDGCGCVTGLQAVGGRISVPVTGQARFAVVRYTGGAPPFYSLYAELEG